MFAVLVGGTFLGVWVTEDSSNEVADLAARTINDRLELSTVVLKASVSGTTTSGDPQRSLAVALRNDDGLTRASIFEFDGTPVAQIDRFTVVTSVAGLPEPAARAIENGDKAFGPIRFDSTLRFEVVDVAVVVDEVVVVGVLRLDNVTEVFRSLAVAADADVYVVSDSAVVFHPEVSRRTSSASVDVDRRVVGGLSGGVVIRGAAEAETIGAIVVADRPAFAALNPVLLATAVLLSVSALTVGFSVRRWRQLEDTVVQPIHRLIATADRIRSDDRDDRDELHARGSASVHMTHVVELFALGTAIDEMGEEIRARVQSIESANARLEASNRDLEEFAYAASHDLQAPLRSIGGFLDLYDEELRTDGVVPSDRAGYLRSRVDEAVRSMYSLIDSLLAYSRVTSARGPFDDEVDLAATVAKVMSALDADVGVASATMDIGPLPVVVGDPVQLRQLFQNLVENAVKFSDPSRPLQIGLAARRVRGAWEVSITDNGIGIAPEFGDQVFLMFRRLHPTANATGQGMGLALCRRIVERHGGAIWVTSEPGVGSTFVFTLPDPADPAAKSTDIIEGVLPTGGDVQDPSEHTEVTA